MVAGELEADPGAVLVPQPHGGALRTGGKPGNASNSAAASPGALKRKARRYLDTLIDDANRLASRGLAPRKQGEPPPSAVEVRNSLDAMRLLAVIAETTTAEDRREDAAAPAPPTIIVETSGPVVRIPLPGESEPTESEGQGDP